MSTIRKIARKAQTRKMANRHRTYHRPGGDLKRTKYRSINNFKKRYRSVVRSLRKFGVTAKQAARSMSAVVLKHSDLPDDIF